MKHNIFIAAVGIAASAAAHGSTVYFQDFNSAANGTTGTGLGDGSNIVTNIPGAAIVQDWAGLKALAITHEGSTGTSSNFFLPDLDPGHTLSSFTADFDLLFQSSDAVYADGLSFNFGQLNNTTSAYGSEFGMYAPGNTGNVLSVGFMTYVGNTQQIITNYNGVTVGANATYPPVVEIRSSGAVPMRHVSISWDETSGLSMIYGGNTVFSNLAIPGFTPEAGYRFAFAARTGADTEDAWIDNLQVQTVPEPSALVLSGLAALGGIWRRRVSR